MPLQAIMTVGQEQCAEERLDLLYRDGCAEKLIPLNRYLVAVLRSVAVIEDAVLDFLARTHWAGCCPTSAATTTGRVLPPLAPDAFLGLADPFARQWA